MDSRTILDQGGAEQLLGHGDMLYLPPGTAVPVRVHGAFCSDEEVHRVVADWRKRGEPTYIDGLLDARGVAESMIGELGTGETTEDEDAVYDEALRFVTETRRASISSVQRKFRIGYNRAARLIEAMEADGFRVTHLYGLTETYGPATVCLPQDDWNQLSLQDRSARLSRQGVHYSTLENAVVKNPDTMQDVPWDGLTYGELMIRGNTVMKGYLKNQNATEQSFANGWLHTGDIAVRHTDGYIEIKDRSKDIIISGGENISSIEIENTLSKHPSVSIAAVVAKPDEKWGETPCAFVELIKDKPATEKDIIDFCRETLAGFKLPKNVIFCDLPKTSTGKIQKFELRKKIKDQS